MEFRIVDVSAEHIRQIRRDRARLLFASVDRGAAEKPDAR